MSVIDDKAAELANAGVMLGDPQNDEQATPDGNGIWRPYANGTIYSKDQATAFAVYGPLIAKYKALGEMQSVLGFPTSDQIASDDGAGCYGNFEQGGMYWRPDTGAFEVHGSIYSTYIAHGGELGSIGYPTSDEHDGDAGKRQNDFTFGVITWSQDDGVHYLVNGVEELTPITITGDPTKFKGLNPKLVDFYSQYNSFATDSEAASGVPAIFSLAQSGIETGYGTGKPGNAMFGIKASSGWAGQKQLLKTTEVFSTPDVTSFPEVISVTPITDPTNPNVGKYFYVVRDWFRAYDSPKDSFDDHGTFLRAQFSSAFSNTDPYAFAHAIANGGYASIGAPAYYAAVSGAMHQFEAIRAAMQE